MLTSGVRNATAALIEQEQSQEDDEVEDHPRGKNKRHRAEPEEDSMADETRGDDNGGRDQAAAGDGGDREGEDSVDEVVPPPRRGKQSLPSQGLELRDLKCVINVMKRRPMKTMQVKTTLAAKRAQVCTSTSFHSTT